jgi:hypothetical protein
MQNEMTLSEAEPVVRSLCAAGQVDRAVRLARRSGISVSASSEVFRMGMLTLFRRDRMSELASILFKNEELRAISPVPVAELLQRMFDLQDYAGFLKQVHRFHLQADLGKQIDTSLKALLESGQVETANAYRLKLTQPRSPIKEGSTNHDRSIHSSCVLCDTAVVALKRIDKRGVRKRGRHCCEFFVGESVVASIYHHEDGLRIYIHCPSDRLDSLLEMAEYGQIKPVHRKDPETVKRSKRPFVATAYCKTDVEMIMPLAAFANQFRVPQPVQPNRPAAVEAVLQPQARVKHLEGARREQTLNVVERNPKARAACLNTHGTKCSVCELDFEEAYGILGRGFIHVHHLIPIATLEQEQHIDPVEDLRPVCPNCHAMLHRRMPPYTISELRRIRLVAAGLKQDNQA